MTPQDRRRARVTLAVTEGEKQAIQRLARALDTTSSDLLRRMALRDILREAGRLEELAA